MKSSRAVLRAPAVHRALPVLSLNSARTNTTGISTTLLKNQQHGQACPCSGCGPHKRTFLTAMTNAENLLHHNNNCPCHLCGTTTSLCLSKNGLFPQSLRRRAFSSAPSSSPEQLKEKVAKRVLDAVQKHLSERIEDLEKEMEEPNANKEEKKKQMELLKQTPSEKSKWEDFAFDQFDRVEVLLEVEEMFGHMIPDDDADRLESVQQCIDYMMKVEGVEEMVQ